MKEFIIEENEAGQRFDKYLAKLLREAPKSFFYKMLRKKNITLNGKKATGNEKLLKGDTIKLFLSDETFVNLQEAVRQQEHTANWILFTRILISLSSINRQGCFHSRQMTGNRPL